MKKYLVGLFLVAIGLTSAIGQTETQPKEEIPDAYNEAIKEFQKSLDTLDMSKAFGMDISKMFGDSLLQGFDLGDMEGLFGEMDIESLMKGMEGMDLGALFGEDMMSQMQQSLQMLEGMDMDELSKMLEGIDMTELEGMLEGIDMSELQQMFEGFPMPESVDPKAAPEDDKLKRRKKI